jgi:hypothetical protein
MMAPAIRRVKTGRTIIRTFDFIEEDAAIENESHDKS